MDISVSETIQRLYRLFETPRSVVEKEFSPYFYLYFSRFFKNPGKFDGYLKLCQYLLRVAEAKGGSVLDLGCGFGMMAILFGLIGAREVIGYDLNNEKIEIFQRLLSYLDSSEVKHVKPVLGDSSKVDFPDESFDAVMANESFSHIREMEESLEEVYRVLKPGGSLLVRDGNNSLFLYGRIKRRRFWRRVENGPVDPSWFRGTDIPMPFKEVRRKMILEKSPGISSEEVELLAGATAGMFGDEITEAIKEFRRLGKIPRTSRFPYRNPLTGEFPEREINPFAQRAMLKRMGFQVSFVPYYYSESFRDPEMAIKKSLHWVEKHLPVAHLFLTPGFCLLGIKKGQPEVQK